MKYEYRKRIKEREWKERDEAIRIDVRNNKEQKKNLMQQQ